MRALVLPWKGLIGFAVAAAVVVGLQSFVYDRIRANTTISTKVACVPALIDPLAASPVMSIKCGKNTDRVNDSGFIVSYLKKPRPFRCTLYQNAGHAECVLPGYTKKAV